MKESKSLLKSKSLSSFMAALLAIILGLIVGFFVMLIANPSNAPTGFWRVLTAGLKKFGDVFYFATPILMTGLSVGFAFKMGLFNIGASGQYTMGMFFAMYVGFMVDMPGSVHWIACILAGMVGGMLWGVIPGIFKALLNVNEVITSIMFNYIGMYLVDMWITNNQTMYVSTQARTAYLPSSSQMPSLGIKDSSVSVGIIIAIVIAICLWVILNKTTFGYELKATGFNKNASTYAGMNGKKNIILTMALAGGLAGLGGAFAILAPSVIQGSSITYEPISVIAANGFNGIAVALLGNAHPIGIIFSSVFISYIQRGGSSASLVGFKPEIIDVVIAVIIYFSAFAMLMNTTVSNFFKKKKEKKIAENAKKVSEDKRVGNDDNVGTEKSNDDDQTIRSIAENINNVTTKEEE